MEFVTRVVPQDDFSLELWFNTGDHRVLVARPFLNRGVFTVLQDIALFKQAFVTLDSALHCAALLLGAKCDCPESLDGQ